MAGFSPGRRLRHRWIRPAPLKNRPCDDRGMDSGVVILHEPARWSLSELAHLAEEPLRSAGARRAIAFGSYARGTADAWSDLDLAIVIDTELPRMERSQLVGDLFDALPVAIDALIYTTEEFKRGMSTGLDVFATISSEGKTVFPVQAGTT